ncbi:BTAD domain-containing putative transcriptional regulator [Streptomyces sp. C]|uniref:AfsR/SARP family transcriptional regulator n=1 Tax=Streptomyces sp. C TaxID=253839 RepID=UPI0001B58352|nr:BTAD domain-containing putative transcriptional regulator [Streptomyces sp. C]
MTALWGDDQPASATASLHNHVARLRRDLGPEGGARLRTVGRGFQLQVAEGEVDCDAFTRHGDRAQEALRLEKWHEAEREAEAALSLWRGAPLAEVTSVAEHPRVAYLKERRLHTLECRFEALLRLGQLDGLSAELALLVAEHPLRESFHRQLMLVFDRTGRQAEALSQYQNLRSMLVDELGVEPGQAVQKAHQLILSGKSHSPSEEKAAPPTVGRPAQLPAAPMHFVGRAEDIEAIRSVLLGPRTHPAVAVISGMAGVGKTGLALHVARGLHDAFPDGQLFLNLHAATPGVSPLESCQAVAMLLHGMGVDPRLIPASSARASALLRSTLADKRVLLVLDDVSSVSQIRPSLPAGPGCAVLVTSRLPLATLDSGKHIRLGPLPPATSSLLLGKASGRSLTVDDSASVDRLVALCGGIPLALPITAARLASRESLTLEALSERLTALEGRLDHLELDDLSVRRSLAVAHEDLTSSGEQRDLDAAAALTRLGSLDLPEYSARLPAHLMDVSEVRADLALERLAEVALLDELPAGRYAPHDLVRDFARELAACHPARSHHSQLDERALKWYVRSAAACAEALRPGKPSARRSRADAAPVSPDGPSFRDSAEALSWADQEAENLIFLAGQQDGGRMGRQHTIELIEILSPYLHDRGLTQARRRLTHHAIRLARDSGNVEAESTALGSLAIAQYSDGHLNEALLLLEESSAMGTALDPIDQMLTLGNKAALLSSLGRSAEAQQTLAQCLSLRPDPVSDFHEAILLGHQGSVVEPIDARLAISYHLQSLDIATRIGAHALRLVALCNMGNAHLTLGEPEAALSRFAAGLAATATGATHWNAEREIHLGKARVLRLLGRLEAAQRTCEALLELTRQRSDTYATGLAEHEYGHILRDAGEVRAADRHWRSALRTLEGTDAPVLPELRRLVS